MGAGGIEPGALTLQPCIDFVDEWVTVTEEEIGSAIVGMLQNHSKLIEGWSGVYFLLYLLTQRIGSCTAESGVNFSVNN